ncbi:flagellar motor protein MotB [Mesobacillus maritimus]|uniref:flagellar motor protein MotB n=1 Tax=Mesobacillus maritimus TaxID=1643336 RepID=UPI00384A5B4B
MRRSRKQDDHVDESWLIPYADILTLLLALFIVLFASSEVDAKKFEAIAESFNSAMVGGKAVLEFESSIEPIDETSQTTNREESIPSIGDPNERTSEQDTGEMTPERDQKELEDLQYAIEGYIQEKGLSSRLQTELTTQGLLLTITEGVLFSSGSAEVVGESRQFVAEMANMLISDPARQIMIEGHTDNQPIQTLEYPSNWELSSSRAINFMKILLENEKLDPTKFSATGYGEYQPIETNDTAEGRAENRRVEVLIMPYSQQTNE